MREAAVAFDALLLAQAFGPLGKAMGFYGDMVVDLAAQSVARTLAAGSIAQASPRENRP